MAHTIYYGTRDAMAAELGTLVEGLGAFVVEMHNDSGNFAPDGFSTLAEALAEARHVATQYGATVCHIL